MDVTKAEKIVGDPIPLSMEREAGAPDFVAAILVGFGMMQQLDEKKSKEAGHPVYKDVEFFSAKVPGDKQSHTVRHATQRDRDRFPRAYEGFKKRSTTPVQGLPLEQWPQITRGQVTALKMNDIHTVECLSEVHDGHIDKLGQSARELRTKAKAFLAQAKDTAAAQAIAAENEQLKVMMADMQRQITELATKRGKSKEAA